MTSYVGLWPSVHHYVGPLPRTIMELDQVERDFERVIDVGASTTATDNSEQSVYSNTNTNNGPYVRFSPVVTFTVSGSSPFMSWNGSFSYKVVCDAGMVCNEGSTVVGAYAIYDSADFPSSSRLGNLFVRAAYTNVTVPGSSGLFATPGPHNMQFSFDAIIGYRVYVKPCTLTAGA